MIRKEKNAVQWLEFELLAEFPNLVHGVFTRHGGVSPEPYATLNCGGTISGDDPQNVQRNLEKVSEIIGAPLIFGWQCHGKNVVNIPAANPKDLDACDGLITQHSGIGLAIKHADCQAAIFYDPEHQVVANVHCGWRGNVQNIYAETMNKMKQTYGTRPESLLVCISPSLGPDASQFINYRTELPEEFWSFQIKPLYFDLWAIARKQLLDCGVLAEHIEIASMCTYSNSEDFFSYRRGKTVTGHHATVVALKN